MLIQVNKNNIIDHTKKVKVIKMHRHLGNVVYPGDIVTKEGSDLYGCLQARLVVLYQPDPKVESGSDPKVELDPKHKSGAVSESKKKSKFKPKK